MKMIKTDGIHVNLRTCMKLNIIMLGVNCICSVTMDLSIEGVSFTDVKFKARS